ncbi:NAD-dependent epimerase/dehydratase family protein [Nocardia brasiliensis]|uniref:NAD(P)H steroid dehydrogenase n=1 Tax=Nocardia brasiliensis (strain ATCC 700358 / HUJEG-1) TaxID=1133849 RepID=K0EZ46_NOCB7|nr:NAD-dependent epimerase/dehydratase family protein [Nocardia brasiliensis]AFU02767.1 NAD(P)H steroid dehydrogenase [Nocardia brasiliensis ATCC 700358]
MEARLLDNLDNDDLDNGGQEEIMKVFVTGATGFLGRRIVARLVNAGHEVLALVRGSGRTVEGATVVIGDLTEVGRWAGCLAGVEVVIHAGGLVAEWASWSEYDASIVTPTRDLLAAAETHQVRRFVLISSESVMQDGKPLLDVTEADSEPSHQSSRYGRAKLQAEQIVRARQNSIESIVLRPTFIWGPGSTTVADLVCRAMAGRLPLIDHGTAVFEHVHVDNVAAAVVAALTEGTPGATYFITNGEPMPHREFLSGLLEAMNAPMPRRSLPSRILFPFARICEALWSGPLLPGRPPITVFEVEFLALSRRFDISKARHELGYRPIVTFADGLTELR